MKPTTNPTFALAMIGASLIATAFPAAGYAGRYNLCDPASVPANVLEKTRQLPNFDIILKDLVRLCPDAALVVAEAPTATIIPPAPRTRTEDGSSAVAGPGASGSAADAGTQTAESGNGGEGTAGQSGGTQETVGSAPSGGGTSGQGNGCGGNCGNGHGNNDQSNGSTGNGTGNEGKGKGSDK